MNAESVSAYRCSFCGKVYDDPDEANECHNAAEPIDAWSCSRCGTIYSDREEAENCCRAGIESSLY